MINSTEYISSKLAAPEGLTLYLLLDGAAFNNILSFIYETEDQPEWRALYSNTFYETAIEVSPYLIKTNPVSSLFNWFIAEGYPKGLLVRSCQNIDKLGRHLQTNLEAKLPSLEIVLFRFYDPLIFDTYIRHITDDDAQRFCGPISEITWNFDDSFFSFVHVADPESPIDEDPIEISDNCYGELIKESLFRYAKELKLFNEQNLPALSTGKDLSYYVDIIKYARDRNVKTDSGIKLYSLVASKSQSTPALADKIVAIMDNSSLLELEKLVQLRPFASL